MKIISKAILLFAFTLITLSTFAQKDAALSSTYATAWAQKSGIMNVQYLNNFPFSYTNAEGELTGIEIDIIKQFAVWLKIKKGIDVELKFESSDDFAKFYEKVRITKAVSVGAGSVAVTSDRAREIKYSSPYLKNKPVLVSSILRSTLTDVRNISKEFNGMTAVIVKGSVHEKLIKNIKDNYWPDMKVELVESPAVVLDKISGSNKYFGYLDLITYWATIQKESKPLKIHRATQFDTEYFAFIFPKSSDWATVFNEFFDGGLGFPASDAYMDILRKHLSSELINSVALTY
jgi:putative glutamine transport system substrate-binding protein